jgi:hypothetical protein
MQGPVLLSRVRKGSASVRFPHGKFAIFCTALSISNFMEMGTQKDMSRNHLPVGKYSDITKQFRAFIHRQSVRSHPIPSHFPLAHNVLRAS